MIKLSNVFNFSYLKPKNVLNMLILKNWTEITKFQKLNFKLFNKNSFLRTWLSLAYSERCDNQNLVFLYRLFLQKKNMFVYRNFWPLKLFYETHTGHLGNTLLPLSKKGITKKANQELWHLIVTCIYSCPLKIYKNIFRDIFYVSSMVYYFEQESIVFVFSFIW